MSILILMKASFIHLRIEYVSWKDLYLVVERELSNFESNWSLNEDKSK
jgi:hypothetical protein